MAVKIKSELEDMEWSTEEEVQLLYALDGLKPVGINKHLYMARICERLSTALKREVAPDTVWAHLRTLYNLDVLDQMERLPFAEEQVEFSLPESEFSALISKKLAETEEKKMPDFKAEATNKTSKTATPQTSTKSRPQTPKELEKKLINKVVSEPPKRTQKRTRGSMSVESNSPSTTPPPPSVATKRRRI